MWHPKQGVVHISMGLMLFHLDVFHLLGQGLMVRDMMECVQLIRPCELCHSMQHDENGDLHFSDS